jgi:glycosyltransferase involved in cell wall biosynthesis
LRKAITQLIDKINPDIIIGVSYSKADMISSIKSGAKKIIECHEVKYFDSLSIFNRSIFSKVYHNYIYYHFIEKNADLVVTLTNNAKAQWKRAKRVVTIPNSTSIQVKQHSSCEKKRIIAVGRLCEEKGFERLLTIWRTVSSKHPDWQLAIFGEGKLKNKLENIIDTEHLRNVFLYGTTKNIGKEYLNSSICVVTSYYEGFSLVILEAMKHGVPCIAFDCPFGPGSIIQDNLNGFLIKDGDIKQFAERLCYLIENTNIRKDLSNEAIKRAATFDIDVIMNKWKNLFENVL